jgi:predicted N-acetyltransferase YhbS
MAVRIGYLADHLHLAESVAEWLYREWFRGLSLSLEGTEEVLRARAQRDALPVGLVALEDGEPVGTASLVLDTLPNDWECSPFLAGVYVRPAHRGRGIGGQLCRHALIEARRLGIGRLYLYTPGQEAFYIRLGWSRVMETLLETGTAQHLVTLMEYAILELAGRHWWERGA